MQDERGAQENERQTQPRYQKLWWGVSPELARGQCLGFDLEADGFRLA